MAHYPSTTKSAKAEEAKYRAEDDLRTLIRAGEIKKDKARMKAALACAKEQMKSLQEVKSA